MNKPKKSNKNTAAIAQREDNKPKRNSRFLTLGRGSRMDVAIQLCGLLVVLLCIAMAVAAVSPLHDKFSVTLWLGYAAAVLALLGGCLYLQKQHREGNPDTPLELHGLLIPANDQMPEHGCGELPSNAVVVVMGKTGFMTESTSGVSTVNMYGADLMTFNKAEGGVNVSARVFSADNKVVAQITNNEFYVNPPERPFQLKRPDWHTLIVYDSEGRESLFVRYVNPRSVAVRGRFFVNGNVVVANGNSLIFPGGNVFNGGCFSGFSRSGAQIGNDKK
jgi:hypothetical protein